MCSNYSNYYNSNITYLSDVLQFRCCNECYLITWLTLKLPRLYHSTIRGLLNIKNIVITMDNASGGVGKGGSNIPETASGSSTNNAPAAIAAAVPLFGRVPNQYTNPLLPTDTKYVDKSVHMRIVAGPKYSKTCGFHTDTQCNKVVYIMIADHLVLLYSNNLVFSETYFCVYAR